MLFFYVFFIKNIKNSTAKYQIKPSPTSGGGLNLIPRFRKELNYAATLGWRHNLILYGISNAINGIANAVFLQSRKTVLATPLQGCC
jgi:hypothetical protein